MRPDTSRILFATISVDTSLPKKKRDDDDAEAVPPRVLEDLADGEGTGLVEQVVVIEDNRENGAVNDNDPAQSFDSLCSNISEL